MIIFFFFFFDSNDLNRYPIIREAFRLVCANKLLSDMYCDMEEYIAGHIDKRDMYKSLIEIDSPFAMLYKNSYPTKENIHVLWYDFAEKNLDDSDNSEIHKYNSEFQKEIQLSFTEARAIVNWIYRSYENAEKRKDAIKANLHSISEMFSTEALAFSNTIIYVKSKVEINIISSFDRFCKIMQDMDSPKRTFYYRGHSNANYLLIPSIMRKSSWQLHEQDMYNELIIECPQDFRHCSTHLDNLVHMQHYGLPTRLLDITKNPLVALYFACESNPTKKGEVIVFSADKEKVKYPGSDTATIIASLPLFKKEAQSDFKKWAEDPKVKQPEFNQKAARLLHEVKLEKPAFKDEIIKNDLLDCFFVLSEKRNNRIIKQDGAFIICGLFDEKKNPINKYRYTENCKIQVFIIEAKKKKDIMKMLNKFSINKACLFPEISDVTEFIKGKY